jgi:arabinogalactan endo-1,4-beta-galactosidase
MLDFHYSDSWADPVKQYTPDAWVGLSDEELTVKIGEYTTEVLQALNEAGATPDYIQTGNEISYGMCWGKRGSSASSLLKVYPWDDANWPRFRNLLNSAIAACRTECPNAKIIIHSERTTKPNDLVQYYTRLYGMDYDIVGLSYYPRFHGPLSVLKTAIDRLTANVATSKKEIMIVETGWYHAYKPNDVPPAVTYADTESGQQQFTQDLVALLRNYDNVTGLFWWWPEANEYNVNWQNPVTKYGWYNAGLWDNNNGRAMKAIADLQELTKPVVDGE